MISILLFTVGLYIAAGVIFSESLKWPFVAIIYVLAHRTSRLFS